MEIWKKQIVDMAKIQKEVLSFRIRNKNDLEKNLKEKIDQLIKNIVL